MNRPLLDQVVNAVLYEGHILYPYRPSSKKNQQRFTFGRVYPQAYSAAQDGAEPFVMQTECLVQVQAASPILETSVRFLHPMARDIGAGPHPSPGAARNQPAPFQAVPELRVDDKLLQSWQEAAEREVK